jgi:signal transduction histidine kinase
VVLLVGVFVGLQLAGILPYHPFISSADSEIMDRPLHVITLYAFFSSMLIISSFFATTFAGRIRRRNEQLDMLRRDLETALGKLTAQDQALSDMTHRTAHELRSPLTAIQSVLNVILEGYSGRISDKMEEMLRRAEMRSRALIRMTSDLLELAKKHELAQKEKTDVCLNEVVERVYKLFSPQAESKELRYELSMSEEDLACVARYEDIQLLVSNLVENAIKYTPSGKSVSIDLSREGHQGKLMVTDTGIGIPPESQLNIFDRFYRAPNARTVEAVGTGLGLTLVKRLVDSYHGTIMFVSEQNSGTAFTIILPLKRIPTAADGPKKA